MAPVHSTLEADVFRATISEFAPLFSSHMTPLQVMLHLAEQCMAQEL